MYIISISVCNYFYYLHLLLNKKESAMSVSVNCVIIFAILIFDIIIMERTCSQHSKACEQREL